MYMYMIGHNKGMCIKGKMFAVGLQLMLIICILKSKSEDQLTDG